MLQGGVSEGREKEFRVSTRHVGRGTAVGRGVDGGDGGVLSLRVKQRKYGTVELHLPLILLIDPTV